jgi:hypothetical protein
MNDTVALWVTAIATGLLALVGAVTYRQNRSLAKAANREADAAMRQADLQLLAYMPQLRPGEVSVQNAGVRNVDIVYAAGSLPAGNIEVWLRVDDSLLHGVYALLSAADRQVNTVVRALSRGPAMTSPFPDMPKTPLPTDERWVGLSWFDAQDQEHRSTWRYTPNNRYELLTVDLGHKAASAPTGLWKFWRRARQEP